MFIFKNLPSELKLIILDYSNFFQEKHKEKYVKVMDIISSLPIFMYEICHLYRGIYPITYYCFEKDNKQTFIIKMKRNYLYLLKINFSIYLKN